MVHFLVCGFVSPVIHSVFCSVGTLRWRVCIIYNDEVCLIEQQKRYGRGN